MTEKGLSERERRNKETKKKQCVSERVERKIEILNENKEKIQREKRNKESKKERVIE